MVNKPGGRWSRNSFLPNTVTIVFGNSWQRTRKWISRHMWQRHMYLCIAAHTGHSYGNYCSSSDRVPPSLSEALTETFPMVGWSVWRLQGTVQCVTKKILLWDLPSFWNFNRYVVSDIYRDIKEIHEMTIVRKRGSTAALCRIDYLTIKNWEEQFARLPKVTKNNCKWIW